MGEQELFTWIGRLLVERFDGYSHLWDDDRWIIDGEVKLPLDVAESLRIMWSMPKADNG